MALSAAIQSIFILVIVVVYSGVVWKSLDSYFRDEFKKHLSQDYKNIQKMKQDRMALMKEKLDMNKLQKDSEEVIEPQGSTEPSSYINDVDKLDTCKKVKRSANKYKGEEKLVEDNMDDNDNGGVCPFVPPSSTASNGDSGG